MEEVKRFREIIYKIRDKEGLVLIGDSITDIGDIKSICRKDYLENLENEISLDEIDLKGEI